MLVFGVLRSIRSFSAECVFALLARFSVRALDSQLRNCRLASAKTERASAAS